MDSRDCDGKSSGTVELWEMGYTDAKGEEYTAVRVDLGFLGFFS
jgi:hypothetical protein